VVCGGEDGCKESEGRELWASQNPPRAVGAGRDASNRPKSLEGSS